MKKIIALLLALVMCAFAFAACAKDEANDDTAKTDSEEIIDNGKLIIGITEYKPMNYYDESGKLIGFDTEFAEAVCEKLGIDADFQVIDWETKETTLKSKDIDCIWNGLTVTEERRANMDFTQSYLVNRQCVVISKDDAATYTSTESLSTAMLSAEGGSAGETAIQDDANLSKATYTAADDQTAAMLALISGNVDAAIVDYTLARAAVGNGSYENYMIAEDIELENENYAIGFRLGSDMTAKVNAIIDDMVKDGSLAKIAEKYEMTDLYEEAVAK